MTTTTTTTPVSEQTTARRAPKAARKTANQMLVSQGIRDWVAQEPDVTDLFITFQYAVPERGLVQVRVSRQDEGFVADEPVFVDEMLRAQEQAEAEAQAAAAAAAAAEDKSAKAKPARKSAKAKTAAAV
jgi:hypothetical protein